MSEKIKRVWVKFSLPHEGMLYQCGQTFAQEHVNGTVIEQSFKKAMAEMDKKIGEPVRLSALKMEVTFD